MCRRREIALAALLALAAAVHAQPLDAAGIGRPATPREVAAWDIDVRPDFKGLPKGSGTVARGMVVWEGKCASCHGIFGESNEVFSPIVGGTTAADVRTGRVARLDDGSFPGRTTLMKVPTVSTLWDYINRAMPWAQPKSLTTDEVYAVTAYILNLGGIVADDFTLSDLTIAEVQERLPNRHGMTTDHALWPGTTFGQRAPDVRSTACMRDCPVEGKLTSTLPDSARNAHGNLALQNRGVGAQRGADTSRPPATAWLGAGALPMAAAGRIATTPSVGARASADAAGGAAALLGKHGCSACHGLDTKVVGPGFREIARRYRGRADAASYLAGKAKGGGAGVWGATPMPAQTLTEAEAQIVGAWLAEGAPP